MDSYNYGGPMCPGCPNWDLYYSGFLIRESRGNLRPITKGSTGGVTIMTMIVLIVLLPCPV